MTDKSVVFVTGTDTDAGKTVISCGLLEKARQEGLSTLAIKPVASGCKTTSKGLRNSDALALLSAMTIGLAYDEVNPIAFEPAIAPHVAAEAQGIVLSSKQLSSVCRKTLAHKADFSLIEGAGGWRVPLTYDGKECLSQLPRQLNIPVVLVVGVKLGCINHARLSVEAVLRDGLSLAGWVANQVDPKMSCFDENIKTLHAVLPGKFLGCVPFLDSPDPANIAKYLSLDGLL